MPSNSNISNTLIEEFLTAISRDWAAMDFRTFDDTVDVFLYDPLIAEPWTRFHTVPLLSRAAKANLSPSQIAPLFPNPSATRCLMCYDLLMAKQARAGVGIYQRIFDWYTSILGAMCREDFFAKNFTNLAHSPGEVSSLVAIMRPATPAIAKKLGQLASACYQLSYGLYSDMNPQLLYDNFGPYPQGPNTLFALKIFHNLRPVELWPETAGLPADSIDIGVRLKNVELKVDAATHAMYIGDQINGLQAWSCTVDGVPIEEQKIDDLRKTIEQMAVAVYTKVKQLNFENKKELYWRQKAWGYKKICDHLGMDWEPAQAIIEAGRDKKVFRGWRYPKEKNELTHFLRDVFDPRIEIPEKWFRTIER